MKPTITVCADGQLTWKCKDCQQICYEEETFGGIMIGWHCDHCGKKQNRGDYENIFVDSHFA